MAMDEIQKVMMVVEMGLQETMLVIPLGNSRYRLASTPLLQIDVEVYWGDVIEADFHEDGLLYFRRIVEHAPLRHMQYILSRKVIESAEFAQLLKDIKSCGGEYEIFMGGVFRCHLPEKSSLDIDARLKRVHESVVSNQGNT